MDRLAEYRGKRDASRTPEPVPPASTGPQAGPGPSAGGIFVVQEHHARRLHWDFRLERDGVLVSWALPKGVPDDPAVNHLAVRTEDHPLEYAEFQGQIPRGEYGAGSVTIWDHGTYELDKWDDREVKVVLHGERLSGRYALFRGNRNAGKDWLIHRDRVLLPAAMRPMLADLGPFPSQEAAAWSVEMKWDGVRALAFIEAGHLTLRSRTGKDITASYPELAGIGNATGRRHVLLDGEVVVLNAAGQADFEALQPRIHVTDPAQARRLAELTPVTYVAFDVLHLDGRPLTDRPYSERRDLLAPLMPNGPAILASPTFPGADFAAVLAASLSHGLEGVVAKRVDSRYEPGARSGNWLKIKNVRRQEVVIAGWKPGKGNREGLVGSLLVGVYAGDELVYCGHVGTGFTDETLRMLSRRLAPLQRDDSPFDGPVPAEHARPAVWVEPRLVAEVAFDRWTRSGRMRAPAYKGLRTDKPPRDIVREEAAAAADPEPQADAAAREEAEEATEGRRGAPAAGGADGEGEGERPLRREASARRGEESPAEGAGEGAKGAAPYGGGSPRGAASASERAQARSGRARGVPRNEGPSTAQPGGTASTGGGSGGSKGGEAPLGGTEKIPVVVDGRALTLTNLSKVLYPADGFTKAEVLDYYQRISPVLLRHVADRPMTLKRYPEGVDGQAFFQKHAPAGTPDWVRTQDIESRSSRGRGGFVRHVVLDDLAALIWAANLASLELHVPMWRLPGPDPDLIVFDLDPGEPATVVECCRVAEALRPRLAEAGLVALPKTSGGKGLQLYARVGGVTAEETIDQALHFAQALERDRPDLVTSRMTRSLRPGKVFIDWSQNKASKTTIAPYSLRARARPTVSTPVTWDEVAACRYPGDLVFTAAEVPDRVAALGDLWEPLA